MAVKIVIVTNLVVVSSFGEKRIVCIIVGVHFYVMDGSMCARAC